MDKIKKKDEGEMGSGESDDEFYNVKLPQTPDSVKKIYSRKEQSPPRTKVQYDYKFDSSSEEESENASKHKDLKESNAKKSSEKAEVLPKESSVLPENTSKVVEKINEELKNMKNAGAKGKGDLNETSATNQNHTATSLASGVSVTQPQLGVVPPVVVVPPPMVVPQSSVMNMGAMIVPSAVGMAGQNIMTMVPSQNMMGMAGNLLRGPSTIGSLMPGATGLGMMGMGLQSGVINPAAMGGINLAMQGNMIRMAGAGSNMFRLQGAGNVMGVPRTMGIPTATGNLIGAPSMMVNPGNVMVMGGMMSNPSLASTNPSASNNSMVRLVNSQGGSAVRPAPPPFPRPRPPLPENFRWPTRLPANISKTSSNTPLSAANLSTQSPAPSLVGKEDCDYDGEELSADSSDKSHNDDSDDSQSPPREVPNSFKNDGSFMEMFKKMSEGINQGGTDKPGGSTETSNPASAIKKPPVVLSGIVGKRRGGRVLKTGLVKKVKKDSDTDEEKHPKDAWSMYMAEVKKYREASCEEEGKTRPLVKLKLYKAMETKGEIVFKTVPYDPRFPNTNQTKNCYQNYLDFHRCQKKRGEDYEACQYFKRVYKALCPNAWIEKWNNQIEEGVFPGRI